MPRQIFIDCDTGRDDALAIWAALADKDTDLRGVYASYGNTPLSNVFANCANVLSVADRGAMVPIFVGADVPSHPHRLFHDMVLGRQAKSGNGLCNLKPQRSGAEPSVPQVVGPIDVAHALGKPDSAVDYVVLGPATNLERLLLKAGAASRIRSITMMGGRLDGMWVQNPTPDFNIACDPYAVANVMHSAAAHAIPMRFVPMNATWDIALPQSEVESLSPTTLVGAWSKQIMLEHCKHFSPEPVFRFHDPSVIAALSREEDFVPDVLRVQTDENAADFGRLYRSNSGQRVSVFRPDAAGQADILSGLLSRLGLQRPIVR